MGLSKWRSEFISDSSHRVYRGRGWCTRRCWISPGGENGSAAFHVYSGELNGARNQENDKVIKSGTAKAAPLPGLVGSPPANEELARTPEPIIRDKQPRRDQAESNRGARPGVRLLREAQQPQTSGDQELQHSQPPSTTGRRGGIARRQQDDVRPYAARTYAAQPSPFFQSW
jgi:hypothetical protein